MFTAARLCPVSVWGRRPRRSLTVRCVLFPNRKSQVPQIMIFTLSPLDIFSLKQGLMVKVSSLLFIWIFSSFLSVWLERKPSNLPKDWLNKKLHWYCTKELVVDFLNCNRPLTLVSVAATAASSGQSRNYSFMSAMGIIIRFITTFDKVGLDKMVKWFIALFTSLLFFQRNEVFHFLSSPRWHSFLGCSAKHYFSLPFIFNQQAQNVFEFNFLTSENKPKWWRHTLTKGFIWKTDDFMTLRKLQQCLTKPRQNSDFFRNLCHSVQRKSQSLPLN